MTEGAGEGLINDYMIKEGTGEWVDNMMIQGVDGTMIEEGGEGVDDTMIQGVDGTMIEGRERQGDTVVECDE